MITSYRLVLLPVWLAGYRYRGQRHQVLVNGQTGAVAGEVPRGGVQKLLAWALDDQS